MTQSPPALPSNVVVLRPRLSSGKLRDFSSGAVFDRHRFCADFQDRWTALVRAEFNGNPVDCAAWFGVTERGAGKWMDGLGGPRGDKVALAVRTIPGAAEYLFADAKARVA